jgi:acyl-CoA thioesterase I
MADTVWKPYSNNHHSSVTKRLIPHCGSGWRTIMLRVRHMSNRMIPLPTWKTPSSRFCSCFCALFLVCQWGITAHAENHSPAELCLAATPSPRISALLPKSAAKLPQKPTSNAQNTFRILALGSSSTRGVGASSWAATYPEVMQREIERLRPRASIEIINQGRNGETIPGQLGRITSDVIPAKPDIVIWQLGSNDVVMPWGGLGADFAELITAGIRQMQAAGADVILMDIQRTPMVMWSSERDALIALVTNAAKATGAGHFRRYELFARAEAAGTSTSDFTSWDGLHNSDAGYDCTGRALARAIDAAWTQGARAANTTRPARRTQP